MTTQQTTVKPQQWTYVYWESDGTYKVMHQVPDSLPGRVISTLIHKGTHNHKLPIVGRIDHDYSAEYAQVQIELGMQYASVEYPLMTCEGNFYTPDQQ